MTQPSGFFTLNIRGHRSGASGGIVQVTGLPLRVATRIRFVGKPAHDEFAILNCVYRKKLYAIRLDKLRLGANAGTSIVIRAGRPHPLFTSMRATVKVVLMRAHVGR